jgi:hypothetical protein
MSVAECEDFLDVNCPRCGYDQRGLIHSWQESCPLEATCTECGLTYQCAETFLPEKFEPPWCVEYCSPRPVTFVWSCAVTFTRSFVPWQFWSRLRMSDRIHPKRIGMYVTVLLACVLLATAGISLIAARMGAAVVTWDRINMAIADDIARKQHQIALLRMRPAIEPIHLRNLPAEEHERAIAEAEWYRQWQIGMLQQEIADMPTVNHSLPLAIFEAVVLPFAKSSFGSIVHADGTVTPYPPPSAVRQGWDGRRSLRIEVTLPLQITMRTDDTLILGIIAYLMFPLTLIMLPMTRRRAKVRWAHIWKVTAYGMIIPFIAFLLAMLLLRMLSSQIGGPRMGSLHIFASVWLIPLAMVIWWTSAASRYMKMPHAFWIGLLHTYIAVMCALALAWMFWPPLLFPDV